MDGPALAASLALLLSGVLAGSRGPAPPAAGPVAPPPPDAPLLDRALCAALRALLTGPNLAAAAAHANRLLGAADPAAPPGPDPRPRLWRLRVTGCRAEGVALRAARPSVELAPGRSVLAADVSLAGRVAATAAVRVALAGAAFDATAVVALQGYRGRAALVLGAPADAWDAAPDPVPAALEALAGTAEYAGLRGLLPPRAPRCELTLEAAEPPDVAVALELGPDHPLLAAAADALLVRRAVEQLVRWRLRGLLRSLTVRLGS